MKIIIIAAAVLAALQTPASAQHQKGPEWLNESVIYQIYPSSFKDSDGNGIGDLPGIISEMDYIQSLGVKSIWFNPMFESGWQDGGYDVKDFYRVDPRFGTNNDLVELINQAHARGMKVMLDLVAGHTSDQHPWFKQSAEDTNLRYSDYYIWTDQLPDEKAEKALERMLQSPHYMQDTTGDWMKLDTKRAKYYMKNFFASQPALNFGYANPDPNHPWEQSVDAPGPRAVKQELKNIISFWYDKGVDGFRVDMAAFLVKNDPGKVATKALWNEMRTWMDETYPDHALVAEWGDPTISLPGGFNADMDLDDPYSKPRRMYFDNKHQADGGAYFSLNGGQPSLKDLYGNAWPEDQIDKATTPAMMLKTYYDHFKGDGNATKELGYIATFTGNHDHNRMNTGARNSAAQLKVMISWVLTMPLPILYYGDEIGLRCLAGLPNVEGANHNGRERTGARCPMQWNSTANAGFSTCAPEKIYIPVCPEWTPATSYQMYLDWKAAGCKNPTTPGMITVENQESDPASMLSYTKSLIAFRNSIPAFWAESDWTPIFSESNPYPMVYTRSDGNETYVVALNPTGEKKTVTIPSQTSAKVGTVIAPSKVEGKASYKAIKTGDQITMGPTSVLIVKVK